ncbi:MAG: efflux RND transporter periplasmic adaptor subunit [Gammaproteobacteria bacterium]|nr:efflux RND transporter periplasmic adaptor subunit [Gammaproteobacteria bacterium]
MRRLLPFILILIFAGATYYTVTHPPEVDKRNQQQVSVIAVETLSVKAAPYRVMVDSFGRVEPHTQGQLVSQVSGQITSVSPNFRDGGFFERDEVLVSVDPRDYQIHVETATAELANARVKYAEEQVLAKQAKKDRKNLINQGQLSDFALHIPQMAAAKLDIAAAEAKLEQARLNVERTRVRAPYAGRVLAKSADIGDVITANASLATIYATDRIEVRLPLKNNDLPFVDLPEPQPNGSPHSGALPRVLLDNRIGNQTEQWPATLVRTASAIDSATQQLHATARIDDPYGAKAQGRRPLKIGQYVTARIEGRLLPNALVIPNAAIYQGSYVYLFVDGVLQRRDIGIAWQNREQALISSGLEDGEQLVLTPLGQVSSGTAVKLLDAKEPQLAKRGEPR